MTTYAFSDAAVEYARYWYQNERRFVDGLASGDRNLRLDALCRAARYFIVSRNFPKRFDVGRGLARLSPALAELDSVPARPLDAGELSATVRSFARSLGAAYGGRNLLSAASKFLWLVRRDVVVIYDSRVRAALGTPFGDYDRYLESWFDAYRRKLDSVHAACSALSVLSLHLQPHDRPSDRELSHLSTQDWFRRRVHDIWLWHLGEPRK